MRLRVRRWYVEIGMFMVFLAAFCIPSDSQAIVESFQFEGRTIIVSDLQVAIACFTFELPCAAANTNTQQIFVNRKFLRMNSDWRTSVLYHEIGHIELGHVAYPWDVIFVLLGWHDNITPREIEADLYAARMGHGRHLLSYFEAIREVFLMAEGAEIVGLRARIDALKEHYVQNLHL